ncbi:TonB-dependent receptor [Aquabacterium olei]|uniref:TonB-dependent receptor n=1 Tax=Aquabacterium olei TaxID=1296669 RepID=A0A2U8FMA9_9BURK|nr:TonB-dependent receptor [Aquabacterium olei]AWI52083.1 TonB-dependent receptor [Aquabacterium olei]
MRHHIAPRRLPASPRLSPLAWATLATCAGLLHTGAARAAETSEAASEVDPVVVSASTRATRLQDAPFAASVVDSRTLRAAGPMVNLSEAMARVPGLVVNNRNNYAQDLQISSRGFGARATFGVRGLRLYTDGIPATMPDGQGQVGHFDLASAQRIEVIRGPFSALYGNAAGGVISLVSQPITERFFESSLDVGSNALYQVRVAGGAPISETLSMSASASSLHTDGPRDRSAADRHLGNVKAEWRLPHDRIVAQLSHHVQQAQDPLGLERKDFDADPDRVAPEARQYNTRKNLNQTQIGTSWQHRFTQAGALQESQLVAYAGRRTVTQYQSIPYDRQPATHSGGVVDFDRDYMGLDGRLNWRWTNVDLVTGVNLEDQYDNRRGYLNYLGPSTGPTQLGVKGTQRRDETNAARTREAYVQAEWSFAPDWAATAGLRSGQVLLVSKDSYLSNGNDTGTMRYDYNTPVLGLRWKAASSWTLHAGVGRGFESPTLGELAYRTSEGGGFNTALKPQTSRHAEIGSKWRPTPGTALDATLFVVNTSNEIGVLSSVGGRSSFQNVGHTQRKGLELSGQWRLTPQWRTAAAFTWLDASYQDNFLTCEGSRCTQANVPVAAGNRIAGTQKQNAFAELVWQPKRGMEAGLEWQARSRTAVNDRNSDFAAGWGIVNVRWLQRFQLDAKGSAIEVLARVDNVGDKRYAGSVIVNDGNGRFFETAAGRNALVSVRYLHGF